MAAKIGTIKLKWHGEGAKAWLEAAANRGIEAVVARGKKLCQQAVSVSGNTGSGAISPRPGGGPPRKYTHSAPGEPPRALTGKGRQSVMSDMIGPAKGVVGTTSKVMAWLERGVSGGKEILPTRKKCLVFPGYDAQGIWTWIFRKRVTQGPIAPRPWLLRTLKNNKDVLQETFEHAARSTPQLGDAKVQVGGK